MRIIVTNNCLDEIVSRVENNRLSDSLTILKGRTSGGSIDISDEFESQDLLQFYNLRNILNQRKAFGYESFSSTFLVQKQKMLLQPIILDLLIEFYNDAATGFQFIKSEQISRIDQIPVFPTITQYRRLN